MQQHTAVTWKRDNFNNDGVFQVTDSLTISEVLNDEAVYDLDLDGDGVVGDTIESVLTNDGQSKAIFKTTTGSYIVDSSTLNVGDQTNDPTLLVTQKVSSSRTTTSLKEFNETITGFVNDNNKLLIYYRDKKNIWHKEEYSKKGVFDDVTTYNLSKLLNDEAKYNIDLNKDNNIGDIIEEIVGKTDKIGLYKTSTGSYIADTADLLVGAYADDPTLLVKQTVYRGKTNANLYDFNGTPTGVVNLTEGGFGVYYSTTSRGVTSWKRDNFDTNGVFKEVQSFSLTEVLTHESNHNLDLNNDGGIGEVIITNITQNNDFGLYVTASGAFVLDEINLTLGDTTSNPTLLVSQKVSGRNISTSLYDFKNTPTGALSFKDGSGVGVYYQHTAVKQHGNATALIQMAYLSRRIR